MIQQTDLAWAAGIIDGEGCITITRSLGKRHATMGYTLRVEVTMGHKNTITRLHQLFAGTFRKSRSFKTNENPAWTWVVRAHQAEKTLILLQPFLVTKSKEVEVALQFRLIRRSSWGRVETSKKVLAQREKFYWRLRKLKPRWRFRTKELQCALS